MGKGVKDKCSHKLGKITGILLVKKPSRYMIKKYGEDKAMMASLSKAIKSK